MLIIVALLIGLILGGLATWLWARAGHAASARLHAAQLAASDQLLASKHDELLREKTAAGEKLALLQESQAQWEARIKAATGDAMAKNQTSLLELTEAKLAPIKETLQKFEVQAKELEERRLKSVTAVGEQLRTVAEGQERLRTETGNLVTALRAPHVRGRWGEVQLKRVVELAGMVAYCDFVEQQSSRDDTGHLLRPDLVVKLAGGKSIVVDSKVPIDAYLAAIECDDVAERAAHLMRHAAQVRDHIVKLGQKQYWRQFEPAPEFVVMFVDEGLFRAALDQDPALFEACARADIVLASPSTLIALLRTVAYGWQQETVAESARAVGKLGRELYERVGVFAGHFGKVGRSLDSAVAAYNTAVGSLESRLLVTARKFPEHGVTGAELEQTQQIERKPVALSASELESPDELVALPRPRSDAA
jgi:DNA recombination protein RmuC